MKRYDYPVAPLVLGVILTPIIDENYRRGIQLARGSTANFFLGMVSNPVPLVILGLMFLSVIVSSPKLMGAIAGLFGKKQ